MICLFSLQIMEMIRLIQELTIQENMYHLLRTQRRMKNGGAIKERRYFCVIGASVAENFGVPMPEGTIGHSVLKELM